MSHSVQRLSDWWRICNSKFQGEHSFKWLGLSMNSFSINAHVPCFTNKCVETSVLGRLEEENRRLRSDAAGAETFEEQQREAVLMQILYMFFRTDCNEYLSKFVSDFLQAQRGLPETGTWIKFACIMISGTLLALSGPFVFPKAWPCMRQSLQTAM